MTDGVKLIFGCGYLGRRVASRWLRAGHAVAVVTRSAERARQFAGDGLEPIVADVTQPDSLGGLPAADSVLFAVGYDRRAEPSLREVYVEGLASVLDRLPAPPRRFIYISSTGVYGQTAGEWVDEDSPTEPNREGGRACLDAEQRLTAHAAAPNAVILRLAGIYGPGRIPRQREIRAGRAIDAPSGGYLNLIHVEDAADIVVAADKAERVAPLLTVSDGRPVVRADYYRRLAELLGAPPPNFIDAEHDSHARRRAETNKRVRNARLMQQIGPALKYPSYREGLAAILAAEQSGQ